MGAPPVYEGKTLEDAVRRGLQALGLSRAEAMITVIEEGSGGFLGFGARPYRVRITARPGGAIREPEERAPREGRDRDRGASRGRRGRDDRPRGRDDRSRGREGRGGEDRGGEGRGREAVAAGGERRSGRDDRPRGRDGRGAGRPLIAESGERREGRGDRRGPERRDPPRDDERRGGDRREGAAREPRFEERRPAAREGGRSPDRVREPEGAPDMAVGDATGAPRGAEEDAARRRRRRGRRGGRGRGGREMETDRMRTAGSQPMAAVAEHSEEPIQQEEPIRHPEPVLREEPVASHVAPEGGRMRQDAPPRNREAPATPMMSNDALAAEGKRWTEALLTAMGFSARVTSVAEQDRVDVTVEVSEGDDLLTGPKGEVRQALQHLLNRMVNRGEGTRYHLQLEINDFWKRREDELRELAGRLADEAVATGREAVTEYLNAQERRIVHVTLRDDARVKTYALGDGMIKRLAVAPADYEGGPRADED